ncbi:small, acid-soluble spore protein, alpha/beta type [Romboutsia timonensis]|uniref:small, acid-soluble spore protein, alpha/beta type n=2 Tax=Peptostreptococcaceae TaxID=186804 RepID=UPI0039995F3B
MANNNNNQKVVPQAKQALNQMKLEIANELGMANYQQMDKGNLTARENGYVGGYMTKKLVEMAEQQMAGKQQYKTRK